MPLVTSVEADLQLLSLFLPSVVQVPGGALDALFFETFPSYSHFGLTHPTLGCVSHNVLIFLPTEVCRMQSGAPA